MPPDAPIRLLDWPGYILGRLFKLITQQRENLACFTFIQAVLLAAVFLFTKLLAVRFTFPFDPFSVQFSGWCIGISYDLLFASAVCLIAVLSCALPKPGNTLRWILFFAIQGLSLLWICVTLINLGFYLQLGSPLKYQALQLVQNTMGMFVENTIKNHPGQLLSILLFALALACLSPVLQRGVLKKMEQHKFQLTWPASAAFLLLGGGTLLSLLPAPGFRENMLREMTVAGILFHEQTAVQTGIAPPTPAETKMVQALCADKNENGTQALKNFPRKKYNIVLWVWESVGIRYIKSLHPLGETPTPNLDRILKAGSISFSECRSESPFSTQSMWALMTGMTPPARPVWFSQEKTLPMPGPFLAPHLKSNGYTTAYFNASNMKVGWMDRILSISGFDVGEDSTTLKGRDNFKGDEFGLEDASAVTRWLQWLDHERPKDQPFFSVLWNKETHFPYIWADMPEEMKSAKEYVRYQAVLQRSDQNLGRVYDALVERGLQQDTLLVILGDHGDATGRPPYVFHIGHAFHPEEDAIHVPLIFAHPGLKGLSPNPVPTRCSIRDVYPTVLDLNGITIPAGLDGHSLAQPFDNKPLFVHSIGWWPISVLAGRYKLTLYHPSQLPQLFDLSADPLEQKNLADLKMDETRTLLNLILRETERRFKEDPTFSWGWTNEKPETPPTIKDVIKQIQK